MFVPADEPGRWPTGGETYLPIDAQELAELLATANPDSTQGPYVASTLLHATMRADGALVGSGLMRVEAVPDGQSWLPLPRSQAHLAEVEWLGGRAAQLGYRGGSDGVGLLVGEPGRLRFEWELTPPSSSTEYRLRWPSSPVTMLLLDLPMDVRCEVAPNSGMLVVGEEEGALTAAREWPTELWPPPLAGTRRWMLTSPPSGELVWQLRRQSPESSGRGPLAEYREELEYQVAGNGTRVVHRVHFTEPVPPTLPLSWSVPPELVVISARWGDRQLAWSREPESDVLTLELAEEEVATEAPSGPIEIEAWGGSKLQEDWTLPLLEPRGGYWLYGRATVEVADELEVSDLAGSNVRHSSGVLAGEPTRLVFEKLRGSGSVTLNLSRRVDRPTIRIGRFIELDGVTAKARMWVVFPRDEAQGRVHHVQAVIDEGWDVETVMARVPYKVDDWYAPGVTSPGPRRLTVRVSSSAEADGRDPLVLEIEARRTAPGNHLHEHAILEVEGAEVVDDYITFDATDPHRLEYLETPSPVPAERLSGVMGVLLPETVGGDVYELDAVAPEGAYRLAQPPAAFDAHVTVQIEEEQPATWRRAGRIQVVPREGLVDRLELRFARSLDQPLRWRLEGESEWRELESPANGDEPGEEVALPLPQPTATPLVVQLDLGSVVADQWEVAPLEIVHAQSQSMVCALRTATPALLEVEGEGFSLLAPRGLASGEALPLHSRWRFDGEFGEARLVIARRQSAAIPPRAHVVRAELRSFYAPGTTSRHLYRMEIANHGERRFQCELPALAEHVRTWRDDEADSHSHPKGTQFELSLPAETERVVYHIEYALPGERVDRGTRLTAPWPQLSLPVVSSGWICEVPRDLEIPASRPGAPRRSWQARMLGILDSMEVPWFSQVSQPRWHAIYVDSPGQLPLEIELVSRRTRTTQCLWLLAASLIAAHLCVKRWPAPTLLAAGGATALSLLVPGGWSLLAAAVSVGLWFGIVVTALSWIVSRAAPAGSIPARASGATAVGVVLMMAGWLVVAAPPVQGQGTEALPPAGATAPQRPLEQAELETLLIPVDDQGREVGERHYVTPRLLRELALRRERRQRGQAWIVSSGDYEGELALASEGNRLAPAAWTLSFEVETFLRDAAVELPLKKSQGAWGETASVDGVPLPLAWNSQGDRCLLRIAEPGLYLVRLGVTPTVADEGDELVLRLDLPPVPGAELRLAVPPNQRGLVVNGRPLAATLEMQRSPTLRLSMEGSLEVRWPKSDTAPLATDMQVTELTWMVVSEDVAEVESVFHVRSTGLLPATIELRSSQPARLVTSDEASSMVGEIETTWTLPVDPIDGLPGEGLVRVHLRLARDQVLGRFPFPQLQLAATTIVERKFAGSSADSLALALDVDTPPALAIDPLEFSYDWPDRTSPVIAVQPMETGTWPVLAVRPARNGISPEESVLVGCFRERLRLEYEGVYPRGLQSRWQQSLRLTPGLVVDEVTMRVGSQQIPIRVARPQPDKLVVFFSTPIQGSYRIEVSAHLPTADQAEGPRELPTLTSSTNTPTMQRLQLFCARGWGVDLVSTDVRPLTEIPTQLPEDWDAYPVGTYQLATQRGAPLEVTMAPSRPHYTVATLTRMMPAANGWVAEVTGVVDVASGKLWEMPIELPQAWAAAIEVDPPVSLRLASTGEGELRAGTLEWGKVATRGDRLTFTLRGPVRRSSRRPIEIPELRAPGSARVERLLALPPVDEAVGYWENLGPRVADSPDWLESTGAVAPGVELYQAPPAGRGNPHLVSRDTSDAQGIVVPLVETQFWFAPDQGGVVRSVVALPPMVSSELEVTLPAGQQLLWLGLDRRAVVVEAREAGYVVQLPAGGQPHGLEIVARLDDRATLGGTVTIAAPQLEVDGQALEVAQRLWTVDEQAGVDVGAIGGGEPMSEFDQRVVRLNQLLATSFDTNSGESAGEGADGAWHEYWIAVLEFARQGLEQAMARRSEAGEVVIDQPTDEEYNDLLRRAAQRVADLRSTMPPRIVDREVGDPWLASLRFGGSRTWRPLAAEPGATEVVARLSDEGLGIGRERWLAALASLVVAATLAMMTRQRRPLWQNEQVLLGLLMLAGVGWWVWLPLGWGGLAMALGAGAAWLRYLRGGLRADEGQLAR